MRLMWRILARMKRFSAREFALLCLPVAAVAGVGIWASRHPIPLIGRKEPKALLQTPDSIQAFDGAKAILKVDVNQAVGGSGKEWIWSNNPNIWLDIHTPLGIKTWRGDGKGNYLSTTTHFSPYDFDNSYSIYLDKIPTEDMILGFKGKVASRNTGKAYPVAGRWEVDRSQYKPFDFSLLREPSLELKSAYIESVFPRQKMAGNSYSLSSVTVRLNFRLKSIDSNQDTASTFLLHKTGYQMSCSVMGGFPDDPKIRICRCTFYEPTKTAPKINSMSLSGRSSANNSWPLDFKIESFDYSNVKETQQLKFKSWPAPLPPGAVTKN